MSICRWCYEKEAVTFDGLCQECADAIRKEKKETEQFDLDKWLKEDKAIDKCSVLYKYCMDCRNFINCLQLIRKPDPLLTVKCPCFRALNLEIVGRK